MWRRFLRPVVSLGPARSIGIAFIMIGIERAVEGIPGARESADAQVNETLPIDIAGQAFQPFAGAAPNGAGRVRRRQDVDELRLLLASGFGDLARSNSTTL